MAAHRRQPVVGSNASPEASAAPGVARHAAMWSLLLAISSALGCAGYQIGNQSLYPPNIRTVYVPMVESTSFRRDLGQRLTEAVMKEIELKTPYKVTGDSRADSVLSMRLVGETKRVVVGARTGEPRELQVDLEVQVQWLDASRGTSIRQPRTIQLPRDVVEVGAVGNLVPETGQSVATAQQKAIGRIAEQIVSLMEVPAL